MSLYQLEYFIAVAEAGQVRGASRALGVAQPAMSRQILLLEHELATPLFSRGARGMALSRPGEVLLAHARTIVLGVRAAESAAREAAEADTSSLDLAQLTTFVAVADSGNVGRASKALHVAQPALSRRIQKLERGIGAQLFIRSSRGMILSERGNVFLPHARAVVREMHAAHAAVRAWSS